MFKYPFYLRYFKDFICIYKDMDGCWGLYGNFLTEFVVTILDPFNEFYFFFCGVFIKLLLLWLFFISCNSRYPLKFFASKGSSIWTNSYGLIFVNFYGSYLIKSKLDFLLDCCYFLLLFCWRGTSIFV